MGRVGLVVVGVSNLNGCFFGGLVLLFTCTEWIKCEYGRSHSYLDLAMEASVSIGMGDDVIVVYIGCGL